MVDAATYTAAALLLAFACYRRVVDRRGADEPAMGYVCWFALATGSALLVLAPRTMRALDAHGPVPRFGVLAGAELKLCGLTALALLARTLTGPDRGPARRQACRAWAALTAMAALFVSAHLTGRAGSGQVSGSGRWFLVAYDLLFVVYAVHCLTVFITLLGRHARRMAPSPLRTGLRLMTAGASVGVLWTLWLLTDVAQVIGSGRQDTAEDPQSAALAVLVAVLAVSGATATVWGRALAAPRRVVRAFRAYRALEPLWSALCDAHPGISLAPSGERDCLRGRPGPRQVQFALYRRVIEIHDGRLSLRPYCPQDVSGRLTARAGPDGQAGADRADRAHTDAAVEAAALAAGLEARREGLVRLPRPAAAPPPAAPGPGPGSGPGGTMDADVAWLLLVAEAFDGLVADREEPRPGRGDQAGAVTR